MAKKVKIVLKLQLPAGKANPAPPVGTALGPHGVNIAQFCKEFNDKTAKLGDTVVPVEMTIFEDRSFAFILKTSPASNLILKAANIKKGSANPLIIKVGKITAKQVKEIAQEKFEDLNANDLPGAEKIIRGTARSMGVEVID